MDVVAYLKEVESKYNVKILYANESGSRAWGFESVDSDFDIRFLYAEQIPHYLQLTIPKRDTISIMDGDLDIHGWDIRKALNLLKVPNASLLEWLYSPIVYQDWDLLPRLRGMVKMLSKPAMFHYSAMAKNNYEDVIRNKEVVNLKKYFYVIRPLLAARWIYFHKTNPPVRFTDLLPLLPERLSLTVMSLLEKKRAGSEMLNQTPLPELNAWIEQELVDVHIICKSLPDESPNDYAELNKLFLEIIGFE